MFFDANGNSVGGTVGCASFPDGLKTGSFLKNVTLPCYRLEGMVTERYGIELGVVAVGEGQTMVLGGANKGKNETQFTVTSYTPATAEILPYELTYCGQ